mgnify:CR=1 FL=1
MLPKLKIPVLTMYPVHDAGFYPFSNVEENAKLMTSAKANVANPETNAKGTTCGHIVPWELPKKYCELVEKLAEWGEEIHAEIYSRRSTLYATLGKYGESLADARTIKSWSL